MIRFTHIVEQKSGERRNDNVVSIGSMNKRSELLTDMLALYVG
ncbi:hypothetical protein [Alteromonas sp. H39]